MNMVLSYGDACTFELFEFITQVFGVQISSSNVVSIVIFFLQSVKWLKLKAGSCLERDLCLPRRWGGLYGAAAGQLTTVG